MKKQITTILLLAISTMTLGGCFEQEDPQTQTRLEASYKKIYRKLPSKIAQHQEYNAEKKIKVDKEKLGGLLSDKYIAQADKDKELQAKTKQEPQEKIKVFDPVFYQPILRSDVIKQQEEEGFTVNTHGPEGYIEQLGVTGRSAEGYIENTGGQSHAIAGYVEAMGSQSHGTEGYIESTGSKNHDIVGYIESTGGQNHEIAGYIENTSGQNHEIAGYVEATGYQNHEVAGYVEAVGSQNNGAEGYVESAGSQTHSEGYIETLGVTHNWTDELIHEIWSYWNMDGLFMQALLGEDEYIQGYTHKLGITGREEEQGYVEKTGAYSHGTEGYIEHFYY